MVLSKAHNMLAPKNQDIFFFLSCIQNHLAMAKAHQFDLFIGQILMVLHQTHIKPIQHRPFHVGFMAHGADFCKSPHKILTLERVIESRILS